MAHDDEVHLPGNVGDQGMAHLMSLGEPGRSARSLAGLTSRIPAIAARLR